jgi:hypothetical protein
MFTSKIAKPKTETAKNATSNRLVQRSELPSRAVGGVAELDRLAAGVPGTQAPGIVYEVLQSSGRSLDSPTRASAQRRFGFDFSHVRIHTDDRAAESARAVHARAYTVGQHIAFGANEFSPSSDRGRRLLFHELTHTLQQRHFSLADGGRALRVGPVDDVYEAEAQEASSSQVNVPGAKAASERVMDARLQRQPPGGSIDVDVEQTPEVPGVKLPQVSGSTLAASGGSPYATILPGYSQLGESCGAASLVSALIIWDREHWKPSEPNSRVVTACNLILTEFVHRGTQAVQGWTANPTAEARAVATKTGTTVKEVYDVIRESFNRDLTNIRDAGRQPGAKISEADYQKIGLALYFLWNQGARSGLSSADIGSIQNALGLAENKPGASTNIQSFDDLFSNSVVTGLQPDQIAQAGWFEKTGQQHAFLIGRLQTGVWFLSDQGTSPATQFQAASIAMLQATVRAAIGSGSYPLYGGTVTDYLKAGGPIPGWLGVKLLAAETGVESKAQNLIGSGAFLAEVDAGLFTIGDRLTCDAFIARVYSLADAQSRFPASSRGGGVIVEMPQGVFSLYSTSAVSQSNLSQTSLDAADSQNGVLVRNRQNFLHTWLILGTSSGAHGSWFSVF